MAVVVALATAHPVAKSCALLECRKAIPHQNALGKTDLLQGRAHGGPRPSPTPTVGNIWRLYKGNLDTPTPICPVLGRKQPCRKPACTTASNNDDTGHGASES
jgi:hypothetical protein